MVKKKTIEEFIKNSKLNQCGRRYGYDRITLKNGVKTKEEIYCYACEKYFIQTAEVHERGKGCRDCGRRRGAGKKRFRVDEVIKQAEKANPGMFLFDRVKDKYENKETKVEIGCVDCGNYFLQSMEHNEKSKYGCPECSLIHRGENSRIHWETIEKEIYEVHLKGEYGYKKAKDQYTTKKEKVPIYCYRCNDYFNQSMESHLIGSGCSLCVNKSEKNLYEMLKKETKWDIIRNRGFEWCKSEEKNNKLQYDYIIEDLKLIIELDGIQHFEEVKFFKNCPEQQLKNDTFKIKKAMENGYSVIRVFQPDFIKVKKKQLIFFKLISSIQRYRIPQLICIGEIYRGRFNIENLTLLI